MEWRQLLTFNLYPAVIMQDGVAIPDWLGYCLAYVQTCAPATVGWMGWSAWEAWDKRTEYRHMDRDLPSGVYVPIWFSYWADLDGTGIKNWGHIAIYKDGKVWCSPISKKRAPDVWNSIEEVERRYGAKFVGWSEDLNGVKVIEGGDMKNFTKAQINQLTQLAFNREAREDEKAVYETQDATDVLNSFLHSPDNVNMRTAAAQFPTWQKALDEAYKRIDGLTAAQVKTSDSDSAAKLAEIRKILDKPISK